MEDSGSPIIFYIIIFLIYILLDTVLYAYGAAIRSINENDIEKREKSGDIRKVKLVLNYKNNPKPLSDTIQIAANLCCILMGCVVIHILNSPVLAVHIFTQILVIFIFLLLIYIFCVYIPQILGAYYAEYVAFGLVGTIRIIVNIFRPLTGLVTLIVYAVTRILGIEPRKPQEDVTEEEIISMVNEGHEQGVLEASEAEMIHNIFEFGDKEAQDIMIHRKSIVAVDGILTLKDALNLILDRAYSRFPVYEDTIDNITGIIHLKNAMKFYATGQYDNWLIKDIPDLVNPAVFIPETRNISQLFKSMQSRKLQMVIVADEYGQTAGLIALEDILEEIVGNIQDEYDIEEDMIEPCEDAGYFMNGMTSLSEVKDTLGIEFDLDENIETLNGFLISRLDKIPSEDEHSTIEEMGYAFQILNVVNKTIEKVKVSKLQETDACKKGTKE